MKDFYTNVERFGNYILWRGYRNGERYENKFKFQPTLWRDTGGKEETDAHTLIGDIPVSPRRFDSIRECQTYLDEYSDVENFQLYGSTNYVTQSIQEQHPENIEFDYDAINIFKFDIEVDIEFGFPNISEADKEVTAVAIKSSKSKYYYLLSLKDYNPEQTLLDIDPTLIKFVKCKDERHLLRVFVQIWTHNMPDIVTGWNVEFFDIAYIVKRIANIFGEDKIKELSPWGSVKKKTVQMFGKEQPTYVISGISIIDYMDAFKKFGYKYGPQPSYKLDSIANVVLGEKKLSYEEYGNLANLWKENPQLYNDYCLKDTWIIDRMEQETKLMALVVTIAYKGGVNYVDAFGTVGIWEAFIYRILRQRGLVPHVKKAQHNEKQSLAGGFVKDPQVGMHRWVVSLDLASLYPHLMMQYNMSPETFQRDGLAEVDIDAVLAGSWKNDTPFSVAANGARFRNDKLGIIPSIIDGLYNERADTKKKMIGIEKQMELVKDQDELSTLKSQEVQLFNTQMSIKILMNALYGAVANLYFLYYINEMAEAITKSGQLSVKHAANTLNEYMNKILKTKDYDYVIYIDTDSCYLNSNELVRQMVPKEMQGDVDKVEKFLDRVAKTKLQPKLDEAYDDLAKRMGAYRNAMSMKLEKISDRAVFVAKKRYVTHTLSNEGVRYTTPKVSVTGIEAVRSSTPKVCQDKLIEAFRIIMEKDEKETQEFIANFREEFKRLPVEDIGKIVGLNDINSYIDSSGEFKKGCPIHVRGAALFNRHLEENGLQKRYNFIIPGDKVKLVYLKEPNPTKQNVIGFVDVLPKEFELQEYIAYDLQFDKIFLKPLQIVLDAIGWDYEARSTLEDFFG